MKNILREAFDGGGNVLDTAPEYGDSEEVIGKALKELGLPEKFKTVTKIPRIPEKQYCKVLFFSLNDALLLFAPLT